MKLAIAGAAGRMGRVLTRIVHETPGCAVAGGLEPKGSPHVGADMGELAGIGKLGVTVTDDPLTLFTQDRRHRRFHRARGNAGAVRARGPGAHRACDRHHRHR